MQTNAKENTSKKAKKTHKNFYNWKNSCNFANDYGFNKRMHKNYVSLLLIKHITKKKHYSKNIYI